MKKKGFTLVELLGVIAILALLATVATPAIISLSNKIKGNMYDAKVELIEENAILYVEKLSARYGGYDSLVIQLNNLCSHKFCYNESCTSFTEMTFITPDDNLTVAECVKNPVNNEIMGEKCYMKITKQTNGRYTVDFPVDSSGNPSEDPACLK